MDPMVILTNKGDHKPSFLSDIWNPMLGAFFGFGVAMFTNWGFRKPVLAGIQKHIAFTFAGGALATYIDGKRNDHLAKRDAVLRHYVELHPDDFPVKERKKYGEVLEAWSPIR